jgi:hypothetical protein
MSMDIDFTYDPNKTIKVLDNKGGMSMDIDFTYDPNKTITEKMVKYHKKLIDDKFNGTVVVKFRKGHIAKIREMKDILRYYPD